MASEPRRVLIVEDSPTMCQMYRMVLGTNPSFDLVFAANGLEGLDQAAQEANLDLMLVDINMPQMDGLEFLRRVRGELGMTGVPAIVVSTEAEDSDRRAAFDAGATGYLRKPWTPAQLLEAIADATRETERR